MMKIVPVRSAFLLFVAVFSTAAWSQDLAGPWTLRIKDQAQREISTATIRFTDEAAQSCLAGNWKRITVEAAKTSDAGFFPIADPLSYQIDGAKLTIGRNGVCDAYLHLRGTFDGKSAEGLYTGFGLHGGKPLGAFSLSRNP